MRYLMAGLIVLLALAGVSLFVGVSDVSLAALLAADGDSRPMLVLLGSRIPRTLAVILAGASMAIADLLMQMIVRNRFVEPSTIGTVESASLGFLLVTIFAPQWPVVGKMLVAALFALAGTALFLRLLHWVPLRDPLLVPLIGIMLGGVISAVATFIAYRFDLMASMLAWAMGDFSGILRGRYELLWVGFAGTVLAWVAADRFTVAGLGEQVSTSLGLNYHALVALGLCIVALVTASVVVTVGMVPFLGLIVPNVVRLMIGDNMRRAVPWVALGGASFVLACDIFGRVARAPYEIPIGVVVGVIGSAVFIYLLMRKPYAAS
ncbi:iron ABC transporter permease [Lampropedia cohaerens]|uniref:Iron ABC transporter permease n=2 Tax=Lampropedia cohaerens TaxID=1610491 RepID=A0A0U1Q0U0_9BURK|nr:iron ABC transporter permease [Lampropedia cohaerens]